MEDWCINVVDFEGNEETIDKIQQLFITMAEKEKKEKKGQLPAFTTLEEGYLFNITCNSVAKGVFDFRTKWAPVLEVVMKIADYYKANFTMNYMALGSRIYGRAFYQDGTLTRIDLDVEDFEAVGYDLDSDTFHFEGETCKYEWKILEILLKRKIDNHFNLSKKN